MRTTCRPVRRTHCKRWRTRGRQTPLDKAFPHSSRSAGRLGHLDRSEGDTMAGPFAGVRIIDISSVLMGPVATELFADLGADVIKVESPDGDILRGIGPS